MRLSLTWLAPCGLSGLLGRAITRVVPLLAFLAAALSLVGLVGPPFIHSPGTWRFSLCLIFGWPFRCMHTSCFSALFDYFMFLLLEMSVLLTGL